MRTGVRRLAFAAVAAMMIVSGMPAAVSAQDYHGGWHGGGGDHWRGGGNWHGDHDWHGGWGGFGLGLLPGFLFGYGVAHYYAPPPAYGPDCVLRRRWLINRWGYRVLRWVRICY